MAHLSYGQKEKESALDTIPFTRHVSCRRIWLPWTLAKSKKGLDFEEVATLYFIFFY